MHLYVFLRVKLYHALSQIRVFTYKSACVRIFTRVYTCKSPCFLVRLRDFLIKTVSQSSAAAVKPGVFSCVWDLFQQKQRVFSCFGSRGGSESSAAALKPRVFSCVWDIFAQKACVFSCLGLWEGSGDDFGAIVWAVRSRTRRSNTIIAHLGSILGSILGSKIDNLGYRFCVIFYDVFYVAFGTFWGRFGSHFGVQRVTKTRNSEIWKIAVLLK